eukprot:NODE_4334_length_825_cov_48.693299_g4005_i0.p2 GENE.NODE_4334_length_825_cov_48.693299_g4005_i0~~NODE_4334_length_825_cov_48.693299_g4005_i0.p2  ORF type:complete len:101 (+),score=15.67 NODE_4334_length_825_cov_48.693299_g4005_i0:422-724(+)
MANSMKVQKLPEFADTAGFTQVLEELESHFETVEVSHGVANDSVSALTASTEEVERLMEQLADESGLELLNDITVGDSPLPTAATATIASHGKVFAAPTC